MKKIFVFSNNIYKGNFKKEFFLFSLKKNIKLFKYLFIHIWYKLLLILKLINENYYNEKYYAYLKEINIKKTSKEFWKKNSKKINKSLINKKDIIIDDSPSVLFEPLDFKITCNDKKYLSLNNIIKNNINDNSEIYLNKFEKNFKNNNLFIKIGKKYYKYGKDYFKKVILLYTFYVFLIVFLSLILSLISLYFATGEFGLQMFKFYIKSNILLLLNTFPIILLMGLLFLIFNNLSISFIITSIITMILTFINYFKIIFRNDPFIYLDISLASEAKQMLNTYSISFPIEFFISIIVLIIIGIILIKYFKIKIDFKSIRLLGIILIFIMGIISYNIIYISDYIYNNLSYAAIVNFNSKTQKYINRGFIYPFIYSTKTKYIEVPANYSEDKVKEIISNYEYENIDEDKKVHVIAIMLESFSDFSKVNGFEFQIDLYEKWHKLEENSYNGSLISAVFAGGTINTERRFLTGLIKEASPISPINSYVRYFSEQGYTTTGSHPGFSWFYNRANINEYLGFDSYKFYADKDKTNLEDKYLWNNFANDKYVFEEIYNEYKKNVENNKYLFNFSVTYQNHGPQDVGYSGKEYIIRKETYDEASVNATNYYFNGITNTIDEIDSFVNRLSKEDEPIVLILFGDHKPDLGNNKLGYNMLNINADLSTMEGLTNMYETPYIIWANPSAKEVLNNDFIGQGPTISPDYLMNEFFSLAGYKGNEYMQFTNTVKEKISVVQNGIFIENNNLTTKLLKESEKIYSDYKLVEYYYYTKKYQN